MGTQGGLRLIATLIGGGLLIYAAVAVFRGTLYDVEDGRVDRPARPVTFWLLVFSMTVLGVPSDWAALTSHRCSERPNPRM